MTAQRGEAWRATPAPATDADRAAIESRVRDYLEGWFEADGTSMERVLHEGWQIVNAHWRWADGHGPRV